MGLLSYMFLSLVVVGFFAVRDLPGALAPAGSCNKVPSRFMAAGIVALLFAGICLYKGIGTGRMPHDYLMAVFPAAVATLLVGMFMKGASIVFALAGASAGMRMAREGLSAIDWMVPLSWMAAIALTVLLSMLLYRLCSTISSRSDSHLLVHMDTMGGIITVAAAFMLVAMGFNLAILIPSGLGMEAQLMVVAFVMLAALFLLRKRFGTASFRLMERWFDTGAESVLAITVSVTVVLAGYSLLGLMDGSGLAPTALAPGLLAFAGLAGCRIAQGQDAQWAALGTRVGADIVLTPLLALMLGYLFSELLHGGGVTPDGTMVFILGMLSCLAILLLAAMALRFHSKSRTSGKTLREQEEQLYENRRAINEMEIRTMQTENENLHNLLQLKRQELMNVAMNISEQKAFIEGLYETVKLAQAETDVAKKDSLLRGMRTELNLRMNFTNEIDSFYAQVEQLHKDFTIRMTGKFPQLTKQERRLATLLRLGFSTKYIAALMNIAPTSVEIGRHRLRTKLGLSRGQNLTEFVKTI